MFGEPTPCQPLSMNVVHKQFKLVHKADDPPIQTNSYLLQGLE